MKRKIFNWLMKDIEIRKLAFREVIGDTEVKQVNVSDVENLELHDCIIYKSDISKCKNANIHNNTFDLCVIKEMIWKSDNNV